MRYTVLGAVFALSASAVLSFGCNSGASPPANSFTEVYTKTIQPKCSNDYCHYNGASLPFSGLDLSSQEHAYSSLVGVPCTSNNCSQRGMRVVRGDTEKSILYLKLLEDTDAGTTKRCGNQMPLDMTTFRTNGIADLKFSGTTLPADEQNRIEAWIKEGAQDN